MVFGIGLIEFSTSRKCCFWLYFHSLHDFWPPSTWNALEHTSLDEMERCEKRAFQLLKMRKKKIIWNIKTKCVTYFLLTVRSSSRKDYTCDYVLSTKRKYVYINFNKNNENLEIFCLQGIGYVNTRISFPICMVVVKASGKFDLHIHFTFLQEFKPPTIPKYLIFFRIIYMFVVMASGKCDLHMHFTFIQEF